jgi:long-chain acyl-CoA synthetase
VPQVYSSCYKITIREKATRLFDCIPVQAAAPKTDFLTAKVNGVWRSYSTQEVHTMVNQLSMALLKMGISAGDGTNEGRDKIGLISNGRPEWVIVDLAVQQIGAVLVPLYPNTGTKEIEQILVESAIKYIFVSNKELCDKVNIVHPNTPELKHVYSFDELDYCINWTKLLEPLPDDYRQQISAISDKIKGDDLATIIYTSGTTGRPKGVMLSHKNILSNVEASGDILTQIPLNEKHAFSFLPMNHIFEKMCMYIYLYYGFSVSFAESVDTIGANIREIKPSIFTAVPRLLEKIFERIMAEGQKLTGAKKKIFLWAVSVAEQFEIENRSAWYNFKLSIAEKLVFSKWRAAIGGNLKAIVIGSSACPVKLEKIFTAAGMVVLEGYGLTETSPVITVNHYQPEGRKFGTVGPLIKDVQVKIAADGEILCKGPNVMMGYYKNPGLTADVMQDNWFCTGDIGIIDEQGFLKITDRKKEIFKTSGGKYVAPLPIENKMKENNFIEQMMVVGAGKKFTGALIVPSYTNLAPWCRANDVPFTTHENVIKDKRVISLFQSVVDGFNPEFNHVEQVKKIVLLPEEWSIDSGELTPTGKMKRKVIMEKYDTEIEKMYSGEPNENALAVS